MQRTYAKSKHESRKSTLAELVPTLFYKFHFRGDGYLVIDIIQRVEFIPEYNKIQKYR